MTLMTPDQPEQSTNSGDVVRVWTPLTIAVYGLLLAYPAALVLAVKNWQALGMYREAGRHVLGAFVVSIPLIGLMIFSPPRTARLFALAVNIGAFSYFKAKLRSDIAEAAAAVPSPTIVYRKWYSALGWALLGICALLVFAVIIELTLAVAGVEVPE